jgi:hypothetical protein
VTVVDTDLVDAWAESLKQYGVEREAARRLATTVGGDPRVYTIQPLSDEQYRAAAETVETVLSEMDLTALDVQQSKVALAQDDLIRDFYRVNDLEREAPRQGRNVQSDAGYARSVPPTETERDDTDETGDGEAGETEDEDAHEGETEGTESDE